MKLLFLVIQNHGKGHRTIGEGSHDCLDELAEPLPISVGQRIGFLAALIEDGAAGDRVGGVPHRHIQRRSRLRAIQRLDGAAQYGLQLGDLIGVGGVNAHVQELYSQAVIDPKILPKNGLTGG